jgi:hypothetical protein
VWAIQLVLVRDRNIDINSSKANKKIADKKKTLIIFSRERAGDIKKSLSTTAISRELFGFTPYITLNEGLEEFVNWQKVIV